MTETTFVRRGVQIKARPADWNPLEHPRDRRGRFIEVGATVSIWGGATGTVVRNTGNGRLEVEREDGKRVLVHRNYLTVIERPDGEEPTADRDEAAAAPVEDASPDAVEAEETTASSADVAKPVYSDVDGESDPTTEEEPMFDPTDEDITAAAATPAPEDAQHAAEDAADANLDIDAPATAEDGEVIETATTYRFPAAYEDAAIASIETANRRAKRAGIEDRFNYSIEYEDVESTDPETGFKTYERFAILTLDRPTVEHDGWTFAATLTWDDEAGLITRTAPGAILIDRPEARKCDVCNSVRDRRDTYVVQKGNEELQVGSNCLTQFMGIRPAGLWMLGFEPDVREDSDGEGGFGGRGEQRVSSAEMLAVTLAVANEHGWVSRGRASEFQMASADRVMDIMFGRGGNSDARRYREEMRDKAEGYGDDAAGLLDFARNMDGDSDYAINLRAAAQPDTVSPRNIPLLASAVASHAAVQERMARERAERERAQSSEHIGAVGDKIENVKARVLGVRVTEGFRGPTTLFTFMDENGNVIKWWASGNKSDMAAVDDEIVLKGTIKKHDAFRGVDETVITRAKIELTGAAKKRAAERDRKAAEARARAEAEYAAENAERERIVAARRNPAPEGYTPYDGETYLPPGTVVRAKRGSLDEYVNAHVIAGPFDRDGEQRVLLRFITEFPNPVNQSVSSIGSIAPASEQDIAAGQEIARQALADVDVQPGQTAVAYSDRAGLGARITPGQTIRVYTDGRYQNVAVVAVSEDGSIIVRNADGERVTIAATQVTALG